MIRNPVLPGFNPDPSFCRVGDDFYIATSTFEWYPGVQIHHSRDLVNWTLVSRPLNRASQLDLRGNPDSCGVWAPCLSNSDGQFWLVYTDVKRFEGNFKDAHNYIVTAPAVTGPWSDPVYVNSSGFDPSLFHDEDGRKWVLNMVWNHRTGSIGGQPKAPAFDGILLQEWDAGQGRLVGPVTNIYRGTPLGLVEGPHLFKRNGWYYLITAEGGTGYEHAVTMARSRELQGPYETHPQRHLLTSKDAPGAALQRAGHGQIVELADGSVYAAHLCTRPLPGTRRSPLGRETALQRCEWHSDDWLYLAHGGQAPALEVPAPRGAGPRLPRVAVQRQFAGCTALPPEFQWLRTPEPERLFTLTGGALRLFGRESVGSWFEQSLVARRQEDHAFRAETLLRFSPTNYQQAAGLTHYYNRHKFHFLALTWHETLGRVLSILSCPGDWPDTRLQFPLAEPVRLPGHGPVQLAAEVDGERLQFQADWGEGWRDVGPVLDASVISDEGGRGEHASFTGAFVGMLAFDTSGGACAADYERFSYLPRLASTGHAAATAQAAAVDA
ncbi:MAG: glycoside hydrolase family 43 protein [Burkholderiales bacterium]|jgi:xylan 1,4-beta-xylosidase|nr:glycoside hydrolase family 43 protein [Burkholderiales bacterium]